jgi:hypothetical protein
MKTETFGFPEELSKDITPNLPQEVKKLNDMVQELCTFKLTSHYDWIIDGTISVESILEIEKKCPFVFEALSTKGGHNSEYSGSTILEFCLNMNKYKQPIEFSNWLLEKIERNELAEEPIEYDLINDLTSLGKLFLRDCRAIEMSDYFNNLIGNQIKRIFNFKAIDKSRRDKAVFFTEEIITDIRAGIRLFSKDNPIAPIITIASNNGGLCVMSSKEKEQ